MTQDTPQTTPTVRKKKTLKKVAVWTIVALLTPIVTISGVLAYGVKLDLSTHRSEINQWLTKTLDRKTDIKGSMALTLSFSPEIELSDVTIANLKSMPWQPMLSSGYIAAKISVLPLLQNTLKIDYLNLKDISLNLLRDQQGHENWVFKKQPTPSKQPSSSTAFKLVLSNNINAEKVRVNYEDQAKNTYYDGYLDHLALTKPDKWLLVAQGDAMGSEYNLSLTGDLQKLINNQHGQLFAKGSFAGAELDVDANITPFSSGDDSTANISLNWKDTNQIASLLDLDLQHVAPLSITTELSASNKGFAFKDIQVRSPITSANGHINVRFAQNAQQLNIINGKLDIPEIDLRPWLQPQPQMMRASMYAAAQQSPLQKALDQWLVKTRTHFALKIGEIKGLGTPVNTISLNIDGEKGKLSAPMAANIANVAFKGNASIDATEWTSKVDVTLGAKDSQLGEMAGWISGLPNATGHLKNAQLQLTTEGTKLQEWLDNSQLGLTINDANVDWGAKASFAIDKAKLHSGMEQPFSSNVSGKIMNIPVTITAKAGTLSDIINHRDWTPSLHFSSPVIDIKAQGKLVHTHWQQGSWFDLNVHSNDAGKLSPWLGTRASMHGKINFKGKLTNTGEWLDLAIPDVTLLNSQGKIDLQWRPQQGHQFLKLNSQFNTLDFTQLSQFVDKAALPKVEQTVPTQGVNLDVPILRNKVVIADADVNLHVNKMLWAKQQVDNMAFKGKVRDGKLSKSPFSASYAGSVYHGDIAFNINNQLINSQLNLAVNKPNIGRILHQFDIVNNLGMSLDSAKLAVSLSGRTLLELMEQAKIDAQLNGGQLKLADSYTSKAFNIILNQGHFVTGPNTATHLTLDGRAANKPVAINLDSVSLKQANDGRKSIPVKLSANVGEISFKAQSQVVLPIDPKKLNLTFEATTPNLNRFDDFTGIKLPPYGPVKVAASLSMDKIGYHLRNMIINVGSSTLKGHGDFLPPLKGDGRNRPDVKLVLNAPFIQINDFKLKNWQAWLPENQKSKQVIASNHQPVDAISPQGLNLLNAVFKLNVGNVRSGKDWLGAGKLDWTLNNGLLTLKPLHIQLPGGDINIDGSVVAKGDKFAIKLNGLVKNFDYGIIARRIDPKTDMHGKISAKFNLSSIANTPESLMNNANGFIGFAAWPKAFQANLIDLWAVSLADAVLPTFTTKDNSVLNCVAGGFNIHNGNMKQRDLLLDTSRIQVHGAFDASYKKRDFNLYLSPQSKKAQIFSLQTPIEVHGTFDKFNLEVPLSAILKTSIRFTTSPVVAPLQWLFEKPIAANSSAECQRIWQAQ
ncbi:AsmA family protein [Photobacterium kishitanii]|uniref:AsmA family protein n=1 Tax=Photobacterium kishitanii TaxID=318456 RepID=UPI0007F0381F|nr:AsmA family protein [Photobacterium kishitanii]OBU25454.1 AsmA protein [Photobacterium kishitanii]PSW71106.1 AsmA family protein [Photobacterium kishitanii]